MENNYYPIVVQVLPGDDYSVYAYFTDGTIHLFDVKPLIREGGVFSRIADASFFSGMLTVLNDTVAWDLSGCYDPKSCIDIDPFTVYEAPVVGDPLLETV